MASLQEQLDNFKRSIESGAPPYNMSHDAIEMMHRATAELKATGIEGRALKIGDRAPAALPFIVGLDNFRHAHGRQPFA